MSTQFVGRGEELSRNIFWKLLDCEHIVAQVNICFIIDPNEYTLLDTEIQKHNFDFVIRRKQHKDIVVEVNYKHKEKASRKWRQIFIPLIIQAGYDYMTIDDYDCREKGIFHLDSKNRHKPSWDDYRDVIDSLEKAGISP